MAAVSADQWERAMRGFQRLAYLAAVALVLAGMAAAADELLPSDKPIEAVVDHYVDTRLAREGVHPSARSRRRALKSAGCSARP